MEGENSTPQPLLGEDKLSPWKWTWLSCSRLRWWLVRFHTGGCCFTSMLAHTCDSPCRKKWKQKDRCWLWTEGNIWKHRLKHFLMHHTLCSPPPPPPRIYIASLSPEPANNYIIQTGMISMPCPGQGNISIFSTPQQQTHFRCICAAVIRTSPVIPPNSFVAPLPYCIYGCVVAGETSHELFHFSSPPINVWSYFHTFKDWAITGNKIYPPKVSILFYGITGYGKTTCL